LLLLLHYPQLGQELPLDLPLDTLDLPGLDMLQNALTLLKQQPVHNEAQALGLFMTLPQAAAIEQLLQTEEIRPEPVPARRDWQGGLLYLQLMQLDNIIQAKQREKNTDMTQLFELLKKRQDLQKQRQNLSHREN
jgi:hypothetical protein